MKAHIVALAGLAFTLSGVAAAADEASCRTPSAGVGACSWQWAIAHAELEDSLIVLSRKGLYPDPPPADIEAEISALPKNLRETFKPESVIFGKFLVCPLSDSSPAGEEDHRIRACVNGGEDLTVADIGDNWDDLPLKFCPAIKKAFPALVCGGK